MTDVPVQSDTHPPVLVVHEHVPIQLQVDDPTTIHHQGGTSSTTTSTSNDQAIIKTEGDNPDELLLHASANINVNVNVNVNELAVSPASVKIDDVVAGAINDAAQELLVQATNTAVEGHVAVETDHIVGTAQQDAAMTATASELVAMTDPNGMMAGTDPHVVLTGAADPNGPLAGTDPHVMLAGTDPSGSILPSDLTAEVAASAAAVAASLNHQHNDLLLSSEIAQIAAESTNAGTQVSHEEHLASRRQKDRERYASMTNDQRECYNKKRREQYHRQTEDSRRKRRERERNRYHALNNERAKERNARRAALERERYKKLSGNELALRNARRRERAAMLRTQKKVSQQGLVQETTHESLEDHVPAPPPGSDLDMVRVYDNGGLNPELNYETHTIVTEQVVLDNSHVQESSPLDLTLEPGVPHMDLGDADVSTEV